MIYRNIIEAKFIGRPNRFIANCEILGNPVVAHVRNTGRCRELFIPGATVYLEAASGEKRKTGYSLIAVKKSRRLVNIDSAAPNKILKEALGNGSCVLPGIGDITFIKPEARFNDSRFDFYLEAGEQKALIEVKGVTLEEDGVALFPDAPTQRGVRHVEGLIKAKSEGFESYLVFIVQMKGVLSFSPNTRMDPAFSDAVKRARDLGVHVLCYDCNVSPTLLTFGDHVPVLFNS